MPYAAVNDVKDTLEHPHAVARGMVTQMRHESCGEMRFVSSPVKYDGKRMGIRRAPPTLGQHTEEVLVEVLGLSRGEVGALREEGVVA